MSLSGKRKQRERSGQRLFTLTVFGRQTGSCLSHQASWVLLALSSREVMCEREEARHSRVILVLLASYVLFISSAHSAKDAWIWRCKADWHGRVEILVSCVSWNGEELKMEVIVQWPRWPRDCVCLCSSGTAPPLSDLPYYHDPRPWYLEKRCDAFKKYTYKNIIYTRSFKSTCL